MDETAQTLHSSSLDASDRASNGKDTIENAKQQMDVISDSTSTVNEVVKNLAHQTQLTV